VNLRGAADPHDSFCFASVLRDITFQIFGMSLGVSKLLIVALPARIADCCHTLRHAVCRYYTIFSNLWALVFGDRNDVPFSYAVFGQFRVPSPSNIIPSRAGASVVSDWKNNRLYIGGGTAGNSRMNNIW
jgi:hypothetical protein